MQPRPMNENLKPLNWLVGTWLCEKGKGEYPTIEPFPYGEEITFESVGQPILNYSAKTWDPKDGRPMHIDRGFLRIKPGTNELAFMTSHNFGKT